MDNTNEVLKDIHERLDPTFGKTIDCGRGWYDLICKMHLEIMEIDPDYGIYQIKEKFGALRLYFRCAGPHQEALIRKIVARYERASLMTCEETGKPGQLMKKHGRLKALHSSYEEQGWIPVEMKSWPADSE